MMPTVATPYAANLVGAVGFFALSAFIVSRVLAAAPAPVIKAPHVETARVLLQENYTGIIAWVTKNDIKITDTFGVSRTFAISDSTHILMHGLPAGSATYANLRILDHVRITSLSDGADERAETIVVQ